MASISFRHVNKTYPGGVQVVPDLNLEIADKEFVILVGPSGCGKSTTLRMIAGLEDITSGELRIGDQVVNDVAPKDRNIAMVFQNYALYPHMTVYKNIAFGLMQKKVPKDEIDKRVHEAAKALDLEHLLNRKPKAAMRSEISRLHKRLATTFVYVTHDQTEAMTMGDRIVVMKEGIIQQNDTPQNLYDYPCNLFVAGFIGSPQMNFMDAVVMEDKGGYAVKVCGSTIPLDGHMDKAKLAPYVGKTVVLGIRPEDVDAVDAGQAHDLDSTIDIAELMGAEINLHVDCQGNKLVVRTASTFTGREGDGAALVLDTKKIHLFDKETEQAIAH